MRTLNKQRLSAILLCLTVGLSSVGLPVVVVWCSMGADVMMESCNRQAFNSSPMSCCDPGDGINATTPEFKVIPCRSEILFVSASSTSSLPAKVSFQLPVLEVLLVMPAITDAGIARGIEQRVEASPPPLLHENIPVLISSLLI